MIHKMYIETLAKLDEMETEIIQNHPFPITYEDHISERLRKITETKKLVVRQLAESLGIKVVYETQ